MTLFSPQFEVLNDPNYFMHLFVFTLIAMLQLAKVAQFRNGFLPLAIEVGRSKIL